MTQKCWLKLMNVQGDQRKSRKNLSNYSVGLSLNHQSHQYQRKKDNIEIKMYAHNFPFLDAADIIYRFGLNVIRVSNIGTILTSHSRTHSSCPNSQSTPLQHHPVT